MALDVVPSQRTWRCRKAEAIKKTSTRRWLFAVRAAHRRRCARHNTFTAHAACEPSGNFTPHARGYLYRSHEIAIVADDLRGMTIGLDALSSAGNFRQPRCDAMRQCDASGVLAAQNFDVKFAGMHYLDIIEIDVSSWRKHAGASPKCAMGGSTRLASTLNEKCRDARLSGLSPMIIDGISMKSACRRSLAPDAVFHDSSRVHHQPRQPRAIWHLLFHRGESFEGATGDSHDDDERIWAMPCAKRKSGSIRPMTLAAAQEYIVLAPYFHRHENLTTAYATIFSALSEILGRSTSSYIP